MGNEGNPMANVVTRAETLAAEIRRGCAQAAREADALCDLERFTRMNASPDNVQALRKQRRRVSHALVSLNSPIRAYHELVDPSSRPGALGRLLRWLADLSARGASFREGP